MAVTFEQIEPEFTRLRDYILNDLNRIVQQDTGGNYSATIVIVCACDALAQLRSGKKDAGELFFGEMMLPKEWQRVGKSLYDALRNGLVHIYDTKTLMVGNRRLELGISWKKHPHLTFTPDMNCLFLNVQELTRALRDAFDRYEKELKENDKLRDRFYAMSQKERKYAVRGPNEIKAWEVLLPN